MPLELADDGYASAGKRMLDCRPSPRNRMVGPCRCAAFAGPIEAERTASERGSSGKRTGYPRGRDFKSRRSDKTSGSDSNREGFSHLPSTPVPREALANFSQHSRLICEVA